MERGARSGACSFALVAHARVWHNRGMTKYPVALLAVALAVFLLAGHAAHANPVYNAGFRTMGLYNVDPPKRLDVNMWYPASRSERELNYLPWTVNGALNAKPAQGLFPLVAISHSMAGTRFSHHELGEFLARRGFVVVAPNHGHDCMDNMDDLFTFRQLRTRAEEIVLAMDLAFADREVGPLINRGDIGVIGFDSGGTAALLLGGAMPQCAGWESFCARAGARDPYCAPFARQKIGESCAEFPLQASLGDRMIKAVAVIAPAYGMFFGGDSFRDFFPAALLVCAGREKFNPQGLHCEPIARMLGKKARVLDLPQADTGALMSACPPAIEAELPELCQSVSPPERKRIHAELFEALFSFFGGIFDVTPDIAATEATDGGKR